LLAENHRHAAGSAAQMITARAKRNRSGADETQSLFTWPSL